MRKQPSEMGVINWPAIITWLVLIGIGLAFDITNNRAKGHEDAYTFAQVMALVGIPIAAFVGIAFEKIGFWRANRRENKNRT